MSTGKNHWLAEFANCIGGFGVGSSLASQAATESLWLSLRVCVLLLP